MTARVTRTFLEVAGSTDAPDTRVYRFGAQLLTIQTPEISRTVSQTVNFGHSVTYSPINRTVTQTVVLSDTPDVTLPSSFSAAHTMVLSGTAGVTTNSLRVAQTLVMGQDVSNPVPTPVSAANTFVMSDAATSSVTVLDVSHTIRFTQNVAIREWEKSVAQTFVLAGTPNRVLIIAGAIPLSASHTFKVSQHVALVTLDRFITQGMKFSHAAVPDHIRLVSQEFIIGDTHVLNLFLPISATHTIVLQHGFLVEREASECTYDPIFGGGGESTMPKHIPNRLVQGTSVKFVYPATAVPASWTKTATLRNPEIGERFRVQMDRIYRESRMGSLQVYRDDDWPTQETVSATIRLRTEETAQDFLDFVDETLGEDIGFLDWEGNSWKGIMLATAEPIVRTRNDVIDITFELVILGALT